MVNDNELEIIKSVRDSIEKLNKEFFFDENKLGGGLGDSIQLSPEEVFKLNDGLVVARNKLDIIIRNNS